MLKRICMAAALAAVVATAASAADSIPVPARSYKPYVAVSTVYNWSGFYAGVNGGGLWGTTYADPFSWSTQGGAFGATLGYNWQINKIVLGLEGDLDWTNASGSLIAGIDSRAHWLGTARGRVGYAFDRFMPYVTGGLAVGKGTLSIAGFGSDSQVHTGYVVGLGAEYALSRNWSVKGEYLYAGFSEKTYTIGGVAGNGKFDANVVRAGINYKF